MAWMREMGRTHLQRQCPDCGLWKVWIRKDGDDGIPRHDGRRVCSRSALIFTYTDHLGYVWCANCGRIVGFPDRAVA